VSKQQINRNPLNDSTGESEIKNSNKSSQTYRYCTTQPRGVSKQRINKNHLIATIGAAKIENQRKHHKIIDIAMLALKVVSNHRYIENALSCGMEEREIKKSNYTYRLLASE